MVAVERDGTGTPRTGSGLSACRDAVLPLGGALAGVRSIMKRREEPAEPAARRRSLQFVGVNGG